MLENDDRPCLPAKFEPCSDHEFFLTITEGRFHQVKRMCATIGLTVDSLHRVSFAGLDTTGLDKGEFREITLDDIPQELLA